MGLCLLADVLKRNLGAVLTELHQKMMIKDLTVLPYGHQTS